MTIHVTTKLDYTVTTDKDSDDAVAAVEAAAARHGFRVLHVHDVAATLASKGFQQDFYKIVEICQAGAAYQALQADELVGLMMPCKINVYRKNGKIHLSALRPSLIAKFFPNKGLEELAEQVERAVESIVVEAS